MKEDTDKSKGIEVISPRERLENNAIEQENHLNKELECFNSNRQDQWQHKHTPLSANSRKYEN